jgi:hypothetical protein
LHDVTFTFVLLSQAMKEQSAILLQVLEAVSRRDSILDGPNVNLLSDFVAK